MNAAKTIDIQLIHSTETMRAEIPDDLTITDVSLRLAIDRAIEYGRTLPKHIHVECSVVFAVEKEEL